jgi:hypothetical protein
VKIILKWILVNRVQGSGLDSSGAGQVQVVSFCEHGNEPQGPIQDELCSREFVGMLHNEITSLCLCVQGNTNYSVHVFQIYSAYFFVFVHL